ncbi:hypothetical protein MVEN_00138200 [Mycena venus]|uniref:Uncharacterized protein n=1 Tax=Mycena venus TaxID=2733690 RepID=A0A8H6Z0M2_9AGAR|nr:hypothetical protein MVEN_00138200 [Mycena venus]
MAPFAPRSNDSDDDSVEEHRETVNRLRRRISELESQEKKTQSKSNVASQVKSFANLGRAICKGVSTFDSVESLIAEDDRRRDLEDARTRGDEVHEEEEVPTIEQDILHNGYKELCRFIVPLRKLLAEADHEELAPVLSALRSGSRNARSDDTKNVREAIVPWLVAAFPELSPTLDPDSRENRGIYHDDLGRLLCPVEFDWNDQSVRTAIREGDPNYLITAGSWWAGLYPPGKFDPVRPEAHLFTNVLLLKTYKFIFTSPLSMKTMPKDKEISTLSPTHRGSGSRPRTKPKKLGSKSKRNVAAIVGLRTVTGRSIAYAAVQYRVALSDANHWDDQDGGFDYREFYNNIVEYFEFPPGPVARNEVARLLDWWNTNVFGTTPRWSLYEEHESRLSRETRETSSVALMRAARLARESDV